MNFSLEEEIFDNALNIFMILFCFFIYIIRLIVFCIGVYACICVCMYVFFSRMEKMVSDFKHSKSFRGTFITSRVSTTVLQLVLVSLCFFSFSYGIGILVFCSRFLSVQIVALPTWSDLFVTLVLLLMIFCFCFNFQLNYLVLSLPCYRYFVNFMR